MRRLGMIALLMLAPGQAAALELTLTNSYALNRPASLDYDPTFCGLWIANEGPEAVLVTLQGEELKRVGSGLGRIKAIAIEGDDLIVGDGLGRMQRITKEGMPLGEPFALQGGFADTEGVAVAADGTLVTVEDDPERLTFFTPGGEILRQINTRSLTPPLVEAQGIAIDPRTGHLLIVDDQEGTNSLYEFASDGTFLASVPLWEFGRDPEGIAIRPGSGQLFIAFDEGATVASFDYLPTLPEGAEALPPGADCMMF